MFKRTSLTKTSFLAKKESAGPLSGVIGAEPKDTRPVVRWRSVLDRQQTDDEFLQVINNLMARKGVQRQQEVMAWRQTEKKLRRKKKAAKAARKKNR